MRATDRTEYIVQAIREGASMCEGDARAFLAEHDAHVRAEALAEAGESDRRRGRRSEYWLAHGELMRRGVAAGLDEGDLAVLLYAFEAGVLRDFAEAFGRNGHANAAAVMRRWAAGIRPRGWKGLLPVEAGDRS